MIKQIALILGVFLIMTSLSIKAAEYKGEKPFDIDKTFKEVKNKHGAVLTDEPGLWRIDIEKEASVYFFTKKDHFAYPSMVIRKVIESQNSINIETQGYTAADKKIFEGWLKQFKEQDKLIKRSLQQ
jgi:hypothetical protein